MAKDNSSSIFSFRHLCCIIFIFCIFSFFPFFYWCPCNHSCHTPREISDEKHSRSINLLHYPSAWNNLSFSSEPPSKLLKIALFVKKWPHTSRAGGLERHALTLYLALAKRGHEIHIFTISSPDFSFPKYPISSLYFHLSKPTAGGSLDHASMWKLFQIQNLSRKPFDVVHTESVALTHTQARNISNLAVSWHGIAYETIHSDIIQELVRSPEEPQSRSMIEKLKTVVEEVKFFPSYAHHVATSDHVGDILKRVYMLPEERVHIILNGVDEEVFKPDDSKGKEFRQKFGISDSKLLVMGMSGRLVKDKGHPIMYEALKQILAENKSFRENSLLLVAGDGPWASRYKDLGTNVLVLGPLERVQLAKFYNAIDIFVHPTLRAQGLDQTLLEAMVSGKPVMATRVSSITGSIIVGPEVGYTFSPTVASLKKAINDVWNDGRKVLKKKGQAALHRGLNLFTATEMSAAYERLFLCISGGTYDDRFCQYQPQ